MSDCCLSPVEKTVFNVEFFFESKITPILSVFEQFSDRQMGSDFLSDPVEKRYARWEKQLLILLNFH